MHNGQTNLSAGAMVSARRTLRLVHGGGKTKCGLTVFFECLQINEVLSQPVMALSGNNARGIASFSTSCRPG